MSDNHLNETIQALDQISASTCGAKWYQTTLHLFNGNTQSCHHVKSHRVRMKEIQNAPESLHNSKYKARVRREMLEGKKVSECTYCWDIEKTGSHSDRHFKSSEAWSRPYLTRENLEKNLHTAAPSYLEVAFDNICNLKCMYCSPVYSSSWEAEIKKHGAYPTSRRYNNLTQFKIEQSNPLPKDQSILYKEAFWKWWPDIQSDLQHLRITGGEPLLSADSWRLMEELKTGEHKQLIFSINSNMMIAPKIFEKFVMNLDVLQEKLAKVILFCSIDSVGKRAEYLRHGLEEAVFYENLEALLSRAKNRMQISFMITVSALSVSGLAELLEKIIALQKKYPQHQIDFDTPYLRNPRHLTVLLLPESFQSYLHDAIQVLEKHEMPFRHQEKVRRILEFWKAEPYSGREKSRLLWDFKLMMEEHDRRRKTNFAATFPEYSEFLSGIKKPRWLPAFLNR